MYSKDGYLSPLDVMNRIVAVGNRFGTCVCNLDKEELQTYALKQFWIFAKSIDHLYLLDPHGNVIRGSKHLAEPMDGDEDAKYGPVLNPYDGVLMDFRHLRYMKLSWREFATVYGLMLVGGCAAFYAISTGLFSTVVLGLPFFGLFAYLFMLYQRWSAVKLLNETLGAFRGMAVCFSEQQVSDYLAPDIDDSAPSNDPVSELEVKDAIIQLVDSGELVTRSLARETVGTNLSARGFSRAWGLAAMERPSLSTPGRRVGGIKSDYRNAV